jgi:3'-phosphoadenosine 5'-phosphosulfate sulfotransferase (PAPS reductase)/FAD synthetase
MLYSVGKDSSVLLHLARKAFAPGKIPFPLLHVDTTWKFSEMIGFRDRMAQQHNLDLLVHINQDGVGADMIIDLLAASDAPQHAYSEFEIEFNKLVRKHFPY